MSGGCCVKGTGYGVSVCDVDGCADDFGRGEVGVQGFYRFVRGVKCGAEVEEGEIG